MMRRYTISFFVAVVCTLLTVNHAAAHEMRPALLQIKQTSDQAYEVLWKIPRMDDMVLNIRPVFPDWFQLQKEEAPTPAGGGALLRYVFTTSRDVHQMPIAIKGLEETVVDVIVYISLQNGETFSFTIQPGSPSAVVPAKETLWGTASTYLLLGIEHILLGPDHLLFVLALLLIVSGARRMITTITAFTLAHSITLSMAALGFLGLPGPPVEATIALSIMFLAWEMIHLQEGKPTFTAKKPWLVAFSFGLLHGLGFAGALADIGLPQTQVPAALAFFNIGVELGQLIFIAVALLVIKLIIKHLHFFTAWKKIPAYAIGSIAAFWLIDRVIGFWG